MSLDESPFSSSALLWGFKHLGTSHTYGRHDERWPLSFASLTGAHVIEEGCGGRTVANSDPSEVHNGCLSWLPCLYSQRPVDLVIIIRGTNDVKAHLKLSPEDATGNIVNLILRMEQAASRYGRGGHPFVIVPPAASSCSIQPPVCPRRHRTTPPLSLLRALRAPLRTCGSRRSSLAAGRKACGCRRRWTTELQGDPAVAHQRRDLLAAADPTIPGRDAPECEVVLQATRQPWGG